MAHEVFGERFYGVRKPAWHGLGLVTETPLPAVEALKRIGGYDVELVPLVLQDSGEPAGRSAIVRTPTADDPQRRIFGIVSEQDYSLISPGELCELWDTNVKSPVETIGALRSGETFFLTCKLPEFDVNGDPVENYMLVSHHMTGASALQIRVTPVRVVCMNTLIAAKKASTETYRIIHNADLKRTLAEWLTEVHDGAVARSELLMETLKLFSDTRLRDEEANAYFRSVYADPAPPKTRGPKEFVERQLASYEYALAYTNKSRDAAASLYAGLGRGMDHPAVAGTAYGAYNAVAELQTYRRAAQGDEASAMTAGLWGERALVIEDAFTKAVDLCQRFSAN